MKITPISSSSKGNMYVLEKGDCKLIFEAGISLKKARKKYGFSLSSADGLICSHSHSDHSGYLRDFLSAGVDVFCSEETAEKHGIKENSRTNIVKSTYGFEVGPWKIMTFDTVHDCPGSLGFLIKIGEEKILAVIDTSYLKYKFKGLTRLMIECNYDEKSLSESLNSGSITQAQYNRIVATHFGLENVVEFLKANDLTHLKSIHLLHLSNSNSNEALILKTIQQATGVPVVVCKE